MSVPNTTTTTKKKSTTINTNPSPVIVNQPAVPTDPSQPGPNAAPLLKSPLLVNAVDDKLDEVTLEKPDLVKLQEAYEAVDFEFSESRRKKRSILNEGMERYDLQDALQKKEKKKAVVTDKKALTVKKAMKLSDEDIVKNLGGYSGVDSYLNARYNLMRSKYYALLPTKEMRKLSSKELLRRLRTEYAKTPEKRNKDLIAFYQALVRIKNIEEAEDRDDDYTPPEHPPVAITAEERENNGKILTKNAALIDSLHIKPEEKLKRKDAMNKVMVSGATNKFWSDKDTSNIRPEQIEGSRRILAWMYRNCNKSSESKEGFVYKLTQASPGQILFMFYLIETEKQASPSQTDFLKAMTDYTPDLDRFKDKVVASKLKFWKRLGPDSSDSVINWSKLGEAARFVLHCDVVSDYEKYTKEDADITEELKKPENKGGDKEAALLYDLLIKKGNLMLTLYKAAGLTPDMPTDMIADEKIRQKVLTVISEFSDTFTKLQTLRGSAPEKEAGKDYTDKTGKKKKKKSDIETDEGDLSVMDKIDNLFEVVDGAMNIDTTLQVIGKPVEALTDANGYCVSMSAVTAISSIVGIISGIVTSVGIAKNASTLSLADHIGQALSVSGDMIQGAGDLVQSATDIVGRFVDLGEAVEESSKWIGQTSVRTAAEAFSTVSGGVEFCTGCVSILAGGIQTAAGAIEIGRGISSRRDVKRSRKTLDEIEADKGSLTKDQEALRLFLKHQDRNITAQEVSGTVKMVGGILTMIGGAMTVAGVLAPIGGILAITGSLINIGTNLIYARYKRRLGRKQAVDDSLKLDSIIETLKQTDPSVAAMDDDQLEALKNEARQEALAELGYATYQECFSDLMKKNAIMIYEHVFNMPEGTADHKAFSDAMESLGLKKKRATKPGQKNIPTPETNYAKLMG